MSLVTRKPAFCICEKKTQISFAVTAKLISYFVLATRIVQSLYFLHPKFQASSHLLWLYSPVFVGPGRKPRRPGFSQRGLNSNISDMTSLLMKETTSYMIARLKLNKFKLNGIFQVISCFYHSFHPLFTK